ncbi:hypothetical protein ACFMQL_38020 [Nonomuraea fastidiosa]|jgi:hypothetical protein|uniref:hypothetical protein n=1 Tax=Nonomuraea TaxID=83681 RepID=UPI00324C666B
MRHAERLWHLAHDYGMGQSFTAMWVRGLGIEETADLLGADSTTGKNCAWADLLKGVDVGGGTGVVWIGRLNDDWLQVLHLGTDVPDALPQLSTGRGQALLLIRQP